MTKLVVAILILLIPFTAWASSTVYLKNGRKINCESFWEEGDKIRIQINSGMTIAVDKNTVDFKRMNSNPHKKVREDFSLKFPSKVEEFKATYRHLLGPFEPFYFSYSVDDLKQYRERLEQIKASTLELEYFKKYYKDKLSSDSSDDLKNSYRSIIEVINGNFSFYKNDKDYDLFDRDAYGLSAYKRIKKDLEKGITYLECSEVCECRQKRDMPSEDSLQMCKSSCIRTSVARPHKDAIYDSGNYSSSTECVNRCEEYHYKKIRELKECQ